MDASQFQDELDKRESEKKAQDSNDVEVHAINKAGIKNVEATNTNTRATVQGVKAIKAGVKVTNPDLAKTQDIGEVVDAIHKSNLTAYMANKGLPELADNLSTLSQRTQDLQDKVSSEGLAKVSKQLDQLVKQLGAISKTTGNVQVTVDKKLQSTIDNLTKQIGNIEFNPSVNVSAPDTKVVTTPVDLTPILTSLHAVQTAIEDKETPDNRPDLDPVISGLQSVQDAINSLRFPVPNYVLPFKDINGKDVQVQLDASGNLPTTGGSGGGGTQYTDGAAAVTHPVGTQQVFTNGSSIVTAVSTANPLPVSATFSGSVTSSPTFATSPGSSPTAAYGLIDASFRPVVVGPGTAGTPTGGVLSVQGVAGGTAAPVSGTFWQTTQPVSLATNTPTLQSGSTTAVTQATGTNLHTVVDSGAITATLNPETTKVIGTVNQGTSPWVVSGTVTANAGTNLNTSALATSANQTNATQKTQIVDGSGNVIASTSNALNVAITSGGGSGGTSSSFASTFPSTGTAIGVKNGTSMVNLVADASGNLLVNLSTPLPAGTNVIGHVIADSGSTTAVTGTVAVTESGTWNVGSSSATGSAVPANAFYIAGVNGGNLSGITATNLSADGNTISTAALFSAGFGMTYNGTSWDRMRGALNATNSTGTGIVSTANLAQFDDVSPTSITENQFGNLRMSANRNAYTTIRDAAGNERGVNVTSGNALVVDGSAVTQPVSLTSTTITGTVAATQSGTWSNTVTQGTAANLNATVVGTGTFAAQVAGGTASGSSLTASPVTAGGLAKTTNPTAVTDGQVVNGLYDKLGKQVVVGSLRDLKADAPLTLTSSTAETTLIAAIASTFNDVYGIIVANTSATVCEVVFRDTTGGTPRFSIEVPANDTRGFMLPEGGAYKQTTVNTNWTAQCGTSVASIKLNALYVKNI